MSLDQKASPGAPPINLLTPCQASELLQVPVNTLQMWRSTRKVPLPFCKLGGHVRYRREDIAEFLDRNTLGRG